LKAGKTGNFFELFK